MRLVFVAWMLTLSVVLGAAPRPNILWISCEDTSTWLGFCGEEYADTPNLDRLAKQGVYYKNAYATAPVCSPSRFAIITGTYATAMGTQRLRSEFPVPDTIKGFPSYLRKAGYYCVNNVKTDYNTSNARRIVAESWDDSSAKAHWRNRKPGQPFFAVFNLTETHQSKSFESAPEPLSDPAKRHDPAKAPVPPFYPDTPGARQTIARVHDCITAMDQHAGRILDEVEADGLRNDTIVFFWSDHGQGIPRGKRTLWDTGLRVPLVIRFPDKFGDLGPSCAGSTTDRMVSLMDLGPTLLSMLDLPIPGFMQGQAFLGAKASPERRYVYGARDRVDEVPELSRSVRDGRYLYIRNYMPDRSWLQPESFSDQLGFRRELRWMAAAGKLNEAQLDFAAASKPVEVLYDTETDPWQVRNVAKDPTQKAVLARMRAALGEWQRQSPDLGVIHEWQAAKLCAGGKPLSEAAKAVPLERVLDTAALVGISGKEKELGTRLTDADPTVRYWAVVGLRAAGAKAARYKNELLKALDDASMPVRIEAAGVLVAQWDDSRALNRLGEILSGSDTHAIAHAARTVELLGEKARPLLPQMEEAIKTASEFAKFSLRTAVAKLEGQETLERGKGKRRPR